MVQCFNLQAAIDGTPTCVPHVADCTGWRGGSTPIIKSFQPMTQVGPIWMNIQRLWHWTCYSCCSMLCVWQTGSNGPVNVLIYRMPQKRQSQMCRMWQEILEGGVAPPPLQKVHSPWPRSVPFGWTFSDLDIEPSTVAVPCSVCDKLHRQVFSVSLNSRLVIINGSATSQCSFHLT